MQRRDAIHLGEDGVFTVQGHGADCHLIYDPAEGSGRWLMLYSSHEAAAVVQTLSKHLTLDEGLMALSGQRLEGESDKVSVFMPNGTSFLRPGKVAAEEVLAKYGYVLVDRIVAYALYDPKCAMRPEEAELAIRHALADCEVDLGAIDSIGKPDTGWCCDFTIAFEGYIHIESMTAYVESLLADTELEVTAVVEYEDLGPEPEDAGVVLRFPKAA